MKAILLFIVLFTIANLQPLLAQDKIAEKAREEMKYGAYAQALDSWSKALSMQANNEVYLFQRGLCNLKLNRLDGALEDFNKAVEIVPENAEYLFYQGYVSFEKGDYNSAKTPLDKACKYQPQNVEYFLYKVRNIEMVSNSRAAIEECRKMLRNSNLENPNPEILLLRALLYQKQGDTELAERDVKQALEAHLESARFYASLGLYYQNEPNYPQAITAYAKAHELDKTNIQYIFQQAHILLEINDNRRALEKATRLMQLPNARLLCPNGFVLKAISAALIGDNSVYEASMKDFSSVAKNEKEYVFAAQKLSEMQTQNTEYLKHAKDWAIKAANFNDSYQNNLLLAQIYFKLDETTPAEETAKKALALLPTKKGFDIEKKQITELLAKIEFASHDKTPPFLTITSPVVSRGGVIVEDESEIIIITGVAHDESGVIKVLINGNLAKLEIDGRFEGKTTLKNGQTKILVQAYDKRGNVGENFFEVEKKQTSTPIASEKVKERDDLSKITVGKNYALLIANNNYQNWSQLYNPINDAKAFAKDLEEIYGFTTEVIENCNQEDFEVKIREYASREYADNDQLLIFYAGHGHFVSNGNGKDGVGALVMTDSEPKTARSLKSYMTHANLRSLISAIPCRHTLYIADACFGGTIDRKIEKSRGEQDDIIKDRQNYFNRIMSYEAHWYLTSGGKEYVPDGRPGGHSPFMYKILEAMRSGGGRDGMLTLEEIQSYLTGLKVEPVLGELDQNEPGSNFLFIRKW